MQTIAVYPGTFDPITLGHKDLVRRLVTIFPKVIVAVAADTKKATIFPCDKRVELAKEILKDYNSVEVCSFAGLLVDFARRKKAKVIIRGLRAVSDFEYELQLADVNRHLDEQLETIFLIPSEKYSYVSSSMVREIASLGGDIKRFVHPLVAKELKNFYKK